MYFISSYKNSISLKYENYIKKYYQALFVTRKHTIATESTDKIGEEYYEQIDSLKETVYQIVSDSLPYNYVTAFFFNNYQKYKLRKLRNEKRFLNALYQNALLEAPLSIKDDLLFLIAKEMLSSISKNEPSALDSFSINCKIALYTKCIADVQNQRKVVTFNKYGEDVLMTQEDKAFKFSDLKNSVKNKVVFIDVLASWCVPCRAEMPFAAELRNKYNNQPIALVYISIDDNMPNWKKANIQEGLHKNRCSFFLPAFEKSSFQKEFKISTVPRYILLDKQGKVYRSDAPRPSEPALLKLLEALLKKQ